MWNPKCLTSNIVTRLVRRSKAFQKVNRELESTRARAKQIEAENAELAERTAVIARRLCNVTAQQRKGTYPRIRICVDLDPKTIHAGLLHGNDRTVIKYMGQEIGCMAASEILNANFVRWEE